MNVINTYRTAYITGFLGFWHNHACLVTFLSGATVEGICAKWVKSVADKKALKSGILSCIWAIALLTGMEHALQLGWPAVTWILGYGVGSYVAVKLEK